MKMQGGEGVFLATLKEKKKKTLIEEIKWMSIYAY